MPELVTHADAERLARVDAHCFSGHGNAAWDSAAYANLLRSPAVQAWLAVDGFGEDHAAFGVICFQRVGDEAELYRIGIVPERRGRGHGLWLLDAFLLWCRADGVGRVDLDVRNGNTAARGLYERAGFVEVGRRPAYYQAPLEDAVLYSCQLSEG